MPDDLVTDAFSITREQKEMLTLEAKQKDLKKSQLVRKIFAAYFNRTAVPPITTQAAAVPPLPESTDIQFDHRQVPA